MPSRNAQSKLIYIFTILVVIKYVLYMKHNLKKRKPIFYDLGPSLLHRQSIILQPQKFPC
jgi:hypothetical protein